MQFVVSDLIKAARVYKDDDHGDEDAWLDDADWLRLFNVEYASLYPRWVRAGLIVPDYVDKILQGRTTALNSVLAISGVARKDGTRWYPLEHLQPRLGRAPFLNEDTGTSVGWLARGAGDNFTLELTPPPNNLQYTAPSNGTPATLDMSTVLGQGLMSIDTVLRMKTPGTTEIGIRLIPDAVGGDPYWTQQSAVEWRYHWDWTAHDTEDFEASIAADSSLPFEVATPSTVNEAWTNWNDIQSRTLWAVQFVGGTEPVEEAGNYYVRYYVRPDYFTSASDTVELPYGVDERIVLGMADRAGIKDSTVSRNIKELKFEHDAQLNFLIFGRGDGPRVRRINRTPLRTDRFASPFPTDPRYWLYV
jgi:hypothetical protein